MDPDPRIHTSPDADPDPDPAIFVSALEDVNKKVFVKKVFLFITF
jgi:hypothetical protein